MKAPQLDWKNLPFGYLKTDCNIRTYYKNGAWGKTDASTSEFIDIHMAATALHYGQQAFEGLKAYRGKDHKIKIVDPKADKVYEYCPDATPGPITQRLYDTLLGIQYGDLPDKFGWIEIVS